MLRLVLKPGMHRAHQHAFLSVVNPRSGASRWGYEDMAVNKKNGAPEGYAILWWFTSGIAAV